MTILRVQLTLLCIVAAVAANRHGEWGCGHVAAPDEVSDHLYTKEQLLVACQLQLCIVNRA